MTWPMVAPSSPRRRARTVYRLVPARGGAVAWRTGGTRGPMGGCPHVAEICEGIIAKPVALPRVPGPPGPSLRPCAGQPLGRLARADSQVDAERPQSPRRWRKAAQTDWPRVGSPGRPRGSEPSRAARGYAPPPRGAGSDVSREVIARVEGGLCQRLLLLVFGLGQPAEFSLIHRRGLLRLDADGAQPGLGNAQKPRLPPICQALRVV